MLPDLPQGAVLSETAQSSARLAAGAGALKQAASSGDKKAVHEAAVEFEAVFLSEMLSPIFENLDTDGLFGGGSGEEMYRSLLVREYGRAMARAGGVGIADAVQREILRLQEMTS